MMNEKTMTVTEDMLMGDIMRSYPEVVNTLLEQGMHCLGCPSSQQESLANACYVHGLDARTVTAAVNATIQAHRA